MKVILTAKSVYPFHPFGGVQKYVYNYAKYLSSQDMEVEIVAPLDNGRPRTEIYEGIKYTLLAPSIYWYLEYPIGWLGIHLFSKNLVSYLKGIDFDLLHCFDMTAYQYLKVKDRKPVISQIFTDNYLCNPISLWNILSLFGRNTETIKKEKLKLSPFADTATIWKYPLQYFFKIKPIHYCLAHSEAVFLEEDIFRREVVELFRLNARKCHIVPVGTDISFIDSKIKNVQLSRTSIGFRESDVVLITVNRLAADKGIDKIILALEEIKKKIQNIKLIIIGSGYQEKELLQLIKDKRLEDSVRHFKDIAEDKLYEFYALSDIYISAFSFPGSSISTLEAMACRLPIITTAQPWLAQNGTNGIVLKNNDPVLIKQAVIQLVEEGRLKQKGQVSRNIVQHYDWREITQSAKDKYRDILFAMSAKK